MAYPQQSPFPAKSVDSNAFTTWNDFGKLSPGEVSAYQSLLKSDASGAQAKFEALLQKAPEHPLLNLGLVQSRRMKGELTLSLAEERRRVEGFLSRRQWIPNSLLLRYGLYWSLYVDRINTATQTTKKVPVIDDKAGERIWHDEVQPRLLDVRSKDRRYSLIQASIFSLLSDRERTLVIANAALKSDPNFYQMRLLRAMKLLGGTVSRVRGNGQAFPVPLNERPDPERARRDAVKVTKQAPKWAVGWYIVGILLHSSDKPKSRRYLQHYLSLNPNSPNRVKRAKELLAKG